MSVPDFQSIMLPLLLLAGDGQDHTLSEAIEQLAVYFSLTDEERKEPLPSAQQFKFDNRVGWARTYLGKGRLLDKTGRGRFCITSRGIQVLNSKPSRIDMKYLTQFPEYVQFRSIGRQSSYVSNDGHETEEIDGTSQTPEEILEASYQTLRNNLAQEVLDRVFTCSPKFFEKLVVDLLVTMGYGGSRKDAGQAVGQSGDDGIDGIIKEDRLGLDIVYIQAKRWAATVGRPVVQGFAGTLEGNRARKGVIITTSQFSQEAKDYVTRIEKKIVLIDGEQLAQLMIDYGIGIAEQATYIIKKIDLDYFGDE